MGTNRVYEQRLLLFHCISTCVYLPATLLFLKFNESIYNVGSFEFSLILSLIVFAEALKLLFSTTRSQHTVLGKIDSRQSARSKRYLLKGFKEFAKFSVALSLLFVAYYVTAVLFGAPVFGNYKETATLSLALSVLTFVPGCFHLGIDAALSVLTAPHRQGVGLVSQAVGLNVKTTLLGAWAGAVVIPLDWDRPWQVWPIPCVSGAFVGFLLGNVVTLVKISPLPRLGEKGHR